MGSYYSVTVSKDGENLLTIEPNMISGFGDLSFDDKTEIQNSANQLLSFVGARDYKSLCLSMGACPACIDGSPEAYGCFDCLNTGWSTGDPFKQRDVANEMVDVLRAAVNAGIRLKNYLEKSINAGPLTNNPTREAALMRDFYASIDDAKDKLHLMGAK